MRRILALALLAACHKPPAPGSDADALWDLAPDGTELGVVATPRALQLASRALDTAHQLAATPDFAAYKLEVDGIVAGLLGKPDATLADAGLTTAKGFAMFVTKDGVIGALPVADRDRFVALKGGTRGGSGSASDEVHGATCRPLRGLYICATNEAMFARLGTQSLRGRARLAGARGDVELFAPALDIFGGNGDLALTAQLQPGQIELRGRWAGTPGGALAPFSAIAAPTHDVLGASGFAALNLAPLLTKLPALPIAGGITADQLAKALKGPVIATCPGGTTDLELRVALADPAPVQTLVDHCDELPLAPRPTVTDGTCRMSIPLFSQLDVDVWVENHELRLGAHRGQLPPGQPGAVTAFGKELAHGDWTAVFWGRGTLLDTRGVTPVTGDVPEAAATSIHAMALISEVGAGVKLDPTGIQLRALVRTLWANPPELADKLAAIPGADILHGGSAAQALATPGTPFAADLAAGQGGLVIPGAVLGLSAALLLPELMTLEAPGGESADETRLVVKQYADEAYPQWAQAHPSAACPGDIDELAEYSSYQVLDPWGHKLVAQCGAALPAGATGIAIHSLGPDGVDDTADDIRSW